LRCETSSQPKKAKPSIRNEPPHPDPGDGLLRKPGGRAWERPTAHKQRKTSTRPSEAQIPPKN
jgi:hypothetical protein